MNIQISAPTDELADEDDTELEELKAVGQENTASPSDKVITNVLCW